MAGTKRAAPENGGATKTSSKKRKVDSVPSKFYAVRAGYNPGVYTTWAECQEQTSGFRGAQYKSFLTLEAATAFVAGENPESPTEPTKFYAVAVGNPPGIYADWGSASLAIKGVKGPKYKKFATRDEAEDFMSQFSSEGKAAAAKVVEKTKEKVAERKKAKETGEKIREDMAVIYTDGSSLSNGKCNAQAGVGVWFGPDDARNLSERLAGLPQTNQRAELTAILRALELTPPSESVLIRTDSQYSINCVEVWSDNWARRGWLTAAGDAIKNKDLVMAIRERMDERKAAGSVTSFEWVKGHATDPGNTAADILARKGSRMEV